jgi:hypothetical protein
MSRLPGLWSLAPASANRSRRDWPGAQKRHVPAWVRDGLCWLLCGCGYQPMSRAELPEEEPPPRLRLLLEDIFSSQDE